MFIFAQCLISDHLSKNGAEFSAQLMAYVQLVGVQSTDQGLEQKRYVYPCAMFND